MTQTEYNEMTKQFFNEYVKELKDFYKKYNNEIYSVWKSMGFTFEMWENDREFKIAFIAKIKIMMERNPEVFQA
jgi:hypothetical protein